MKSLLIALSLILCSFSFYFGYHCRDADVERLEYNAQAHWNQAQEQWRQTLGYYDLYIKAYGLANDYYMKLQIYEQLTGIEFEETKVKQ